MLAAETRTTGYFPSATSPQDSRISWGQIVRPVEPFLRAVGEYLAGQVATFEPEVAGHARYALTNQGKQLRPALLALSALASGGLRSEHVTLATVIEMVHLATLVHDDVMDEARVRRCRPTLAVSAGNTTSVLVGDCLFAHALKLAASFPTTAVCRAVSQATKTVCSGEIIQNQRQHHVGVPRAEYFRVLSMKTAELFAVSCELGAELNDPGAGAAQALRRYGLHLGVAYQIYDDCLDLFGNEAAAGKSLGTDLTGGKMTLPLIVAWDRSSLADRTLLTRLIRAWDPAEEPRLRRMLAESHSLDESREVIGDYCAAARDALEGVPLNEGREGLATAADFLAQLTDRLGSTA